MDEPEEIVPRFVDAWMARDAEALAALFVPDADFVNVVGIWWHDRDAIRDAHAYGLGGMFARSTLRAGRVKRLDLGEVVVIHARMHLSGQIAPEKTEAGVRRTILSFVMARSDEGWHCVSAQNTDIIPGAESHLNCDGHLTHVDYRP